MTYDINEEWKNFISSGNDDDDISDDEILDLNTFIQKDEELISANLSFDFNSESPKASDIYISTKTKLGYLNRVIDLNKVFWEIPVIPYAKPCNGVIKKQRKFNSLTIEELDYIKEKLQNVGYFEEHIITSINNPTGRIKFKDIRKVSIGISKKDIMSYRSKKKSAFYNCFVMIVRILVDQTYKEFHVKIFNTGKIEIPGIQSEKVFQMLLSLVITILQPYISEKLEYNTSSEETVLINSNFNCGFFINRETLYDILKFKYNIQSIYDPCSYPGIQCKFYYNTDIITQTGCQISEVNKDLYVNITKISFMVFRTGSILIVGKCDEHVLLTIYEFLKVILKTEYKNICQKNVNMEEVNEKNLKNKDKKKKIRKKNIMITK